MCTKAFDGKPRATFPKMNTIVRGAFAEFVAMTLFVYFGCGAASSNVRKMHMYNGDGVVLAEREWDPASVSIIALQFGLAITVLAYATAHSSGGHINCAVTFALTLVGKCHPGQAVIYLFAQLFGSVFGALLLSATVAQNPGANYGYDKNSTIVDRTGGLGSNGLQNTSVTIAGAFIAELMGTMLLVIVVLETAVNKKACTSVFVEHNQDSLVGNDDEGQLSLAPFPIGFAVFMAHVVLIPITGCSINPTRSFGPSLVADSWDNHWLWWVGPLCGATCGSFLWMAMMMPACNVAATEADRIDADAANTKA